MPSSINEKPPAPSPHAHQQPLARPQRNRRLAILILSALLVGGYLFRDQLQSCFSTSFPGVGCAHGAGEEDWTQLEPGTVKWWDCAGEKGAIPGAECGYIIVPTDYYNASAGVTKLALGRYKATRSRQGMVLVNPGGPGGAGKSLGTRAGQMIQSAVTGETYDIVGFDPRGIGETLPATKCFASRAQDLALKVNTVMDKSFDVGGNLSAPGFREGMRRGMIQADAIYRVQNALCAKTMGESIRYMGSSTVVRDIEFMTKVLEGEEALINFWGGSYGTILGQYLVNMLPDKVGRVALDGIADAVDWSNEPNYKWYRPWLSSTEDAYDIFLESCSHAGEYDCPLTLFKHEEPVYIRKRLERWMDELYEQPLVVDEGGVVGVVTAGLARTFLLWTLEQPSTWVKHSGILAAALAGEGRLLLSTAVFFTPDMSRQAVSCNDAVPLTPQTAASYDDILDEYIDTMKTETKFVMSVVTAEPDSGCQYWPVSPPERFSGPWNHTLRNPIVVLSNTADPVTPIRSARLVKARLRDSAVLALQNAPGHCTISLPSICTIRKARQYFEFGKLPEDGHVCEVSVRPFPQDGAFVEGLVAEERGLVEAGMGLGEVMASLRRA